MKIGEYRGIPMGTPFWSIALQETISIHNHATVKITNTVIGDDDYFYGTLQIIHWNPTLGSSYGDKVNGEIGINYSKTFEVNETTFCGGRTFSNSN